MKAGLQVDGGVAGGGVCRTRGEAGRRRAISGKQDLLKLGGRLDK